MKKIGILTYHKSVNNGAFLQSYALSKALKSRFPDYDVEIINYCMKSVFDSYHYNLKTYLKDCSLKMKIYKIVKLIQEPKMFKRLNRRTQVFEETQKMLPLSKYELISDDFSQLYEYINNNYDILIVGSDAVWNYVTKGFPNAYFPDLRVKCIKASFAASCYGMVFKSFSTNDRHDIGNILSDFSLIGVRDAATAEFVEWCNSNLKPLHTCDPTLTIDLNNLPIDKNEIEKKLSKRGFDFSKETIGIMGNKRMLKLIRKFYGRKYQIVSLYNFLKGADVQLYDFNPFEWAYVFRYFKVTYTTYFHGTMLSLCNGVPVVCFSMNTAFEKTYAPKTLDSLQRLKFDKWFFTTDYKTKDLDIIKQKSDELLKGDFKKEILDNIALERKTAYVFFDRLDDLIIRKEKESK